MNRTNWPLWLLCLGLGIAPWLGGKIAFEPQAIDPKDMLYGALVDGSLPTLAHFGIGIFIVAAFVISSLSKQVVLLPAPKFLALLLLLWLGIGLSISQSEFLHDSILEFSKWTIFLVTLVAVVSTIGRNGVEKVLWAIGIGASVVASFGIYEYLTGPAANWRIFSVWMNPNALAGLLVLALPCVIALGMIAKEIVTRVFLLLMIATCMASLWLTGSKGGLLAFTLGCTAMFGFWIVEKLRNKHAGNLLQRTSMFVIPVLLAVSLVKMAAPNEQSNSPAAQRIFSGGKDSEQSVGFRKKLWAESLKIVKAHPVFGSGIGTYALELPRYATIEGSKVAHNGFLQLLSDSGPLSLFSFIAFGLLWIFQLLAGHPGISEETSWLRCAVFASVVAGIAHTMVESSFTYFGFSVIFFALLGCGLLLSRDGARPEKMPTSSRAILAIGTGIGSLYFLWASGYSQFLTGSAKFEATKGDSDSAISSLSKASTLTPSDAFPVIEMGRLRAAMGDSTEAVRQFQFATKLRPVSSSFALLARAQTDTNQINEAETNFKEAIELSPADPRWKARLFDFYVKQNRSSEATEAARDVVATEHTDYYQFDALPQFVKLDTLDAHLYLADNSKDANVKISELESAFSLLEEYRRKTYFELKRMVGKSGLISFEVMPGESLEKANERFTLLIDVGEKLKSAYMNFGVKPKFDVDKIISELRSD